MQLFATPMALHNTAQGRGSAPWKRFVIMIYPEGVAQGGWRKVQDPFCCPREKRALTSLYAALRYAEGVTQIQPRVAAAHPGKRVCHHDLPRRGCTRGGMASVQPLRGRRACRVFFSQGALTRPWAVLCNAFGVKRWFSTEQGCVVQRLRRKEMVVNRAVLTPFTSRCGKGGSWSARRALCLRLRGRPCNRHRADCVRGFAPCGRPARHATHPWYRRSKRAPRRRVPTRYVRRPCASPRPPRRCVPPDRWPRPARPP